MLTVWSLIVHRCNASLYFLLICIYCELWKYNENLTLCDIFLVRLFTELCSTQSAEIKNNTSILKKRQNKRSATLTFHWGLAILMVPILYTVCLLWLLVGFTEHVAYDRQCASRRYRCALYVSLSPDRSSLSSSFYRDQINEHSKAVYCRSPVSLQCIRHGWQRHCCWARAVAALGCRHNDNIVRHATFWGQNPHFFKNN